MTFSYARKAIRNAGVCGIISTCLTLIIVFYALSQGGEAKLGNMTISWYFIFDVLILAGLTTGIFFKNRFCGVAMAVYFLWSKTITAEASDSAMDTLMAIGFSYFYIESAIAVFYYHKLKPTAESVVPPIITS